MSGNLKTYFQDIHYSRQKPVFALNFVLTAAEFFYKTAICAKNFLYEKNFLKENLIDAFVICVGNLTTGGVGKTPIVAELANEIAKTKKVAVISRGYGAKLQNKTPNVVKDFEGLKFQDGTLVGDEPFQLASKLSKNIVVLTCKNRLKAAQFAVFKYGVEVIILDDGFSNRKLKKDRTILVVDSVMRFGNGHLLPKGPLREPLSEIKRADEIIVVNKGDKNFNNALLWLSSFNTAGLKTSVCKMTPKRIYNAVTKAEINFNLNALSSVLKKQKAVAFCGIGQPGQFYDFLSDYYEIAEKISFEDHHRYTKNDIKKLMKLAAAKDANIFVTTQKDETKLSGLVEDIKDFSFNILELQNKIEEIK